MLSVLCCFWTNSGQWSTLPQKHYRLRVVLLKNSMPNIEEAQKMSTTEVGLKSKYGGRVCSVDACKTRTQGQKNTWIYVGLHLPHLWGRAQQSCGHFVLEVSQETPAASQRPSDTRSIALFWVEHRELFLPVWITERPEKKWPQMNRTMWNRADGVLLQTTQCRNTFTWREQFISG